MTERNETLAGVDGSARQLIFQARSQNGEKRLWVSSCLPVRTHETIRLPLDGFSWSLIFRHFSKICRHNSTFIKIWQEYPALYMKTNTHFCSYLTCFSFKRLMFQTKVVEKIEKRILCSISFLRKSCLLWDVLKCCWSDQSHRWQYGPCGLHARYLSLQTHTQYT